MAGILEVASPGPSVLCSSMTVEGSSISVKWKPFHYDSDILIGSYKSIGDDSVNTPNHPTDNLVQWKYTNMARAHGLLRPSPTGAPSHMILLVHKVFVCMELFYMY